MDRGVQMRVSYWTGWLDPQMVAVSKEVHQLMGVFPGSCAFGISSHYTLKASYRHRSWGIHPRFYQFARPFIGLLERRFDISHVYTGLSDWHFLNALGRRPIVLTVTQNGESGNSALLRKVSRVVAETHRLAEVAIQNGVHRDKVTVIHPGVDLNLFQMSAVPKLPWKCLFASSPENKEEIHSKGVDLILDVAASKSDMQFTILWRPFGPNADVAFDLVRKRASSNVTLIKQRIPDMHRFLQEFHFVVAPFRTVGKPCPNSILESLAVGRPVLVSDYVDIGDLIEREGAGIKFARDQQGFSCAIDNLCQNYNEYQRNARACAERHFDFSQTSEAYRSVYRDLLENDQ